MKNTAQRIAEALARKSGPRAPAKAQEPTGNEEVIGTVPANLRHLHNLLEELADDVAAAQVELNTRNDRLLIAKELFFDSLTSEVSVPKESKGMGILNDWSVVSLSGEQDGDVSEMLGGLEAMLAAMGDHFRRH